ncbi:MAG: hypothetical protein ACHQ2F_01560 [Desulfobaccales bacterium]
MKRTVSWLIVAALFLVPGMAAAQAPAGAPAPPQAQQESPPQAQPQAQPQPQCQPGPGGTCIMPGKMTPEQMKQMQEKMGQCCMMQEGQGCCPKCQQMQKQLDELSQRVDALEGKKKTKKK